MADEQVEKPGVKDGVVVPPNTAEQNGQAKPPVEENSTSERSDNRIPLPRFNEVIEQRNQARELAEKLDARLRAMEDRLPPAKTVGDSEVERLVKSGMPEATAREIVRSAENISGQKNREVQAQLAQNQLSEWHRNMESKYKDYPEMTSEMEKVFTKLPQATQAMCTSSQAGLDMLYHYAKSAKGIDSSKKAFEEGLKSANTLRDAKITVSSTSGKSPKDVSTELSGAVIAKMSSAEYMKRQDEINAWMAGKSRA